MAIYHLHASTGTRKGGQSAGAKSDYIRREGKYTRDPNEVLATGDGNMPTFAADHPAAYWQAADDFERANGRLFKEVEFGLPRELTLEQQQALVNQFAAELTDRECLPFSYAIHKGVQDGVENPHCHLMISERKNDGIEREAGQWFKRLNRKEPEKGGAEKTESLKPEAWLADTRERWAQRANEALERHGHETRIDHRSHAERELETLPGVHIGHRAAAMERRGIETDRGDEQRRIVEINAEIEQARLEADLLSDEIEQIQDLLDTVADMREQDAFAESMSQEVKQKREAAQQPKPEPEPQERPLTRGEAFAAVAERMKARRLAAGGAKSPQKAAEAPTKADPLQSPEIKLKTAEIEAQKRETASAKRLAATAEEKRFNTELDLNSAKLEHTFAERKAREADRAVSAAREKLEGITGWFKGKERKAASAELEQAQAHYQTASGAVLDTDAERRALEHQHQEQRKAAQTAQAKAEKEEQALAGLQKQRSNMIDRATRPPPDPAHDPWAPEPEQEQERDAWSDEADAYRRDHSNSNDGPELEM